MPTRSTALASRLPPLLAGKLPLAGFFDRLNRKNGFERGRELLKLPGRKAIREVPPDPTDVHRGRPAQARMSLRGERGEGAAGV